LYQRASPDSTIVARVAVAPSRSSRQCRRARSRGGEIGLLGVAAAIANAVYNATGKRIRELPITLDKLL